MELLLLCGMLAAGEFCASLCPALSPVWPALALLAALVALFGYGLSVRGWGLLATFVLGATLCFQGTLAEERRIRDCPWMRGRERRMERRAGATACGIRRELVRRMSVGLDGQRETLALGRAILLGERSRLSPRLKRMFVESGTIHVFAISGLHVMAVANVLTLLISCTFLPRRLVGLAAIPLLWGYVQVIGFPPSAVRAALMATFDFLALVFWRRPDGLRSWSLTFLAVHLVCPQQIVNVGSALSFMVMLAVVLTGDLTRNMPRGRRALCVTVAAWAVGVPIAAHVFGRVTPGGMLANLVLLSVARLSVYAGALGLASGFVSRAVSVHLNNLSALAIQAMTMVAEAVSRIPGAHVETDRWPISWCLAWYAALVLAVLPLVRAVRGRRTI